MFNLSSLGNDDKLGFILKFLYFYYYLKITIFKNKNAVVYSDGYTKKEILANSTNCITKGFTLS